MFAGVFDQAEFDEAGGYCVGGAAVIFGYLLKRDVLLKFIPEFLFFFLCPASTGSWLCRVFRLFPGIRCFENLVQRPDPPKAVRNEADRQYPPADTGRLPGTALRCTDRLHQPTPAQFLLLYPSP